MNIRKQSRGIHISIDGDKEALALHCKVDPEKDILQSLWNPKDVFTVGHILVVDHATKSIVLAIRGTMSHHDVLTDLVADYEEFMVDSVACCMTV